MLGHEAAARLLRAVRNVRSDTGATEKAPVQPAAPVSAEQGAPMATRARSGLGTVERTSVVFHVKRLEIAWGGGLLTSPTLVPHRGEVAGVRLLRSRWWRRGQPARSDIHRLEHWAEDCGCRRRRVGLTDTVGVRVPLGSDDTPSGAPNGDSLADVTEAWQPESDGRAVVLAGIGKPPADVHRVGMLPGASDRGTLRCGAGGALAQSPVPLHALCVRHMRSVVNRTRECRCG